MSVHDDAIRILRFLEEKGIVMGYGMKNSEIISGTGLITEAHDKAENFLLQGKYIEGGGGGPDAERWLTNYGVSYLEQIMSQRLPISINAEMILDYIIKSTSRPLQAVKRSDIQTALKLSDDQYDKATQNLLDFDLAEKGGGGASIGESSNDTYHSEGSLRATKSGRQALQKGFRDPQTSIQASQVFNINAPSNIQAVANAINSQIEQQIEQTISENDPEALKEMVSELLTGLVDIVRQDLNLKDQAEYTEAAATLQDEIQKNNPETEILQKWIARLAFLDHAFSVGEKAIALSGKVLPSILMLTKLITALLKG